MRSTLESGETLRVDVLVVGAGPAGAVMGMQLAAQWGGQGRVAMVGRAPRTAHVIGESLPAAARVLLRDLGLWPQFEAQQHRPAWSHVSLWGDDQPVQRDSMQDPHGHGWHLDRARFDELLRDAAMQRGVLWLGPSDVRSMRHTPGARHPWQCTLDEGGTQRQVRCRLLVDATGRAARVLRHAGGEVQRMDRLVCLHTWLPASASAAPALPGATLIEASANGWWYSADLPDGGSVLAFHTDTDLPAARACSTAHDLLQLAMETQLIKARCEGSVAAGATLGVAPAHSQQVARAAGADWLAVGDAALAFDPLASQGLLNCLYTGQVGAAVALRHLQGDEQALPGWVQQVQGITQAYAHNLAQYYAMERRWGKQAFWERRRASASVSAPNQAQPPRK